MKKMFSFLKNYRLAMGIAWTLMLIELAVELLLPLFMARIIDEGILQKDISAVWYWGGIMSALALAAFAAGVTNSFFASHVSQGAGYDIRKSVYEKIQNFSFANFSKFPSSSLITRLTNDVTQLQNSIFTALRIMMRAPLLVIGGTIMALIVDVKLGIILLLVIPFIVFFLLWVLNSGWTMFKFVQQKLDSVNDVIQENLRGMRIIKALLRGNHENNRFIQANKTLMKKTVNALRLMETIMPVLFIVMNGSILFILWMGNIEVANGDAAVGDVVAIVNYATRITGAFSVFSFIIMSFSRARASAGRIEEVLETDIDLVDSEDSDPKLAVKNGKIEFKDVSFHYPGTKTDVLDEINMKIEPREIISILGATGSGKTSLFQLIPRLYEATGGRILIDNVEIEKYKLANLRKSMGFVPQEALLFSGSIKENIAWGKEEATMEEIVEAAKSAQIHDLIEGLPSGYDTVLGQKGVNLSGGQKQRLSIARALVRKPKILILDDSTSALDLKTESKLIQAIGAYSCTILIVTQKISTAIQSDKIFLIEDGKVIVEGCHEKLLNESPLYGKIFQSQFGEENLEHAKALQ
ncbi:ABC transporter ATP-binding protein [Rossellomorea vietnamensis]|uniref:ABC transporter ATP-binding protein n=1 Tax=Rossellomorea vietnamensis TaxID=218284 RepID=A0A5D4MDX5_9BACI|nr:ABC transporter ATP-binding protein [Rossellomorea vietnamensis]TYR99882.1 ABC transporter ATP-binding protein [Rossellomorea vietnamensis]